MLDVDDTRKSPKEGSLITLSVQPIDLMTSNNDELLLLYDDAVWQWDAGPRRMPYRWKSAELTLQGKTTITSVAAKVRYAACMKLSNREGDEYTTLIYSEDGPARVKRLPRSSGVHVEFVGTAIVEYVHLGTTFSSLNLGV
jgi:hypothetical protein